MIILVKLLYESMAGDVVMVKFSGFREFMWMAILIYVDWYLCIIYALNA